MNLMKTPLISIVIPIYNVEQYLAQCLDSVLAQTLQDMEIICLDDGSTDNSLAILKQYQQKDPRIQIICKENTGYGHSMNVGISRAKGKYLSIIEPDDIALPQMLKTLYNTALNHDLPDIIKGKYLYYWSKTNTKKPMNDAFFHQYNVAFSPLDYPSVFLAPPCIWSGIYKRSFIEKHNILFNETKGASFQDTTFNFKSLALAKAMVLVDEAFVLYRQDNTASSVNQPDKVHIITEEFETIDQFISKQSQHQKQDLKRVRNAAIFYAYRWNFERIHPRYQKEFANIMYEEFSTIMEQQRFDRTLFPPKDWEYMKHVLKGSQRFMGYTRRKKLLQALDPIRLIKTIVSK